jgi:hypothetical protein
MMEDGLKVGGHDDTMKVKDISELVLDGLE